ncbi:hypothetical protein [Sphingomonas soli]|uniref:hypothetical protein n=1 Tax=Sphingomonas soli TaxID=266127 RepID=UPI000A453369|nr:hypothetical protein [Sphingomonas soli]
MLALVRSLFFAAALAGAATAASAQDHPDEPLSSGNDIVVTGKLEEEAPRRPLQPETARTSKAFASDGGIFARCLNDSSLDLQRTVVEGHVRDRKTQYALDRLIRSHRGCYPRMHRPNRTSIGYFGRCNPEMAGATSGYTDAISGKADFQSEAVVCRAPYDRMALVEEVYRIYAPHFMLTPADTLNRDVIARFRAREAVRGKYRSPMDRRFYDTVSCMVQLAPEESVRLLRAPSSSARETQLRQAIIAKSAYCTGNAENVSVDPPQFRGYVADALYHWTIAAKNVETLIPGG